MYDLIIIGSGPAGYSAAIYASRGMLNTLIISGDQIGGALTKTLEVENYPGFSSILGNNLMIEMQNHALKFGATIINDSVIDVNKENINGKNYFKIITRNKIYESKSIIIATGSSPNWLGVIGEDKFKGYGISCCATCDGFFYKNKVVAVVGGGNTAIEEALYLSKIANKVYLIHRRDSFRAEKIMQKKLFNTKNIELLTDTVVKECLGDEKFLNAIMIENLKTKQNTKINIDGLFVAIGYSPNTNFFKGLDIKINSSGYIQVFDGKVKTNIDGVFAAGDILENNYKQAVISAASGSIAGIEVIKYLEYIE